MRYARSKFREDADVENISIEPGPNNVCREELADVKYGISIEGERR